MAILRFVPMFAIMFAVYFGIVAGGEAGADAGTTATAAATLANRVMGGTLMSGAAWVLSVGDLLIAIGVFMLYVELFKSTRTGSVAVIDHTLSMLVFIAYIIMFITVTAAGTSVFLILGLLALVDVIAGFTITIAASRRDVSLGSTLG